MKLFRNNFLDIIKILFKIALNIPKLEADNLIMSAREKVYKDWEMKNGKEKKKYKIENQKKSIK